MAIYNNAPLGLVAMPKGLFPSGTISSTVLVEVRTTVRVSVSMPFVIYRNLPFLLTVIPNGKMMSGIVFITLLPEALITEMLLLWVFAT